MDPKAEEKPTTPRATPTLYHLVVFQHFGSSKSSTISRELVRTLQDELDKNIKTPPEQTDIDIWIDSPGGDAHAAYKLILDLRHRSRMLRAIIPDKAKSAATLLALGTDKILMSPYAELGPLDAQIGHPDREGVIVSALDVTNSLEFLGRSALDLALSGGASVIQITGLPRIEALDSVLRFAAQLLTPAMQKLDPHLIHQAASQLTVAERYAQSMLAAGRHDDGLINPSNADTLVTRLVTDYPAHGYVISREEARKLGLSVDEAERHPRWTFMRQLHRKFLDDKSSFLFVVNDRDLDQAPTDVVKSAHGAHGEQQGPAQAESAGGDGGDHADVEPTGTA